MSAAPQELPPERDAQPRSWWLCLDCNHPPMPGINARRHLHDLDHRVVRLR
jgi:hypothetical protein